MGRLAARIYAWMLARLDVDGRAFAALTRMFVLMDLRGQHFARAVGMKPHEALSPLFWVIGQCFAVSAGTSLLLFGKTDVFFFVLANLAASMIAMAALVLVEFHEVVLNPQDLDILGHRPVSARTYVASRLGNLVFYVALMYVALNLFPLILGAGLRESGWWYAPAYLAASLFGNLIVVSLVVLFGSYTRHWPQMERAREVLAWTQIVLFGIVAYGGQLMLKDTSNRVLMWGAFPPDWVAWTPLAWLARLVEGAAVAPRAQLLIPVAALAVAALVCCAVTYRRVCHLYAQMQPVAVAFKDRPLRADRLGAVTNGWIRRFTRGTEERVGFWLCLTLLRRENELWMRSLIPLNLPVVAVALGLLSGQFGNPMIERDVNLVMLPIVGVLAIGFTVPAILYNLSFCRDFEAVWVLMAAPLGDPAGVARGVSKAIMLLVVTPLSIILGIVCAVAWHDPLSAVLHAALSWLLAWPMGLAAMWLVVSSPPFSRPHVRGGSLGPVAIPMLMFSGVFILLAALHLLFAWSWIFWLAAAVCCWGAAWSLRPRATARQQWLWREGL